MSRATVQEPTAAEAPGPGSGVAGDTEAGTTGTGKTEALRALEGEFQVLMRRFRRAVTERAHAVDPALAPLGYQLLDYLRAHGSSSQTTVVEALALDKGAVSRQVQALCELGLVEKREDPDDRRATLVGVSAEGERRLQEMESARRSAYLARFDGWTAEELQTLADQLGRYNRTVG